MSDKEKKELNALANLFYRMHGYEVPYSYDFTKATHPQEKMMYELAKVSNRFWKARNG